MERTVLPNSDYTNFDGEILEARMISAEEKYFKIALSDGKILKYEPGQFVMVAIPGVGEAPLSISSSPTQIGYFELVVRKVGMFTSAMHMLGEGDHLGIRGPLGQGFPIKKLIGADLLFIAGGLGIIPLRSVINYVMDNRRDFGKITILVGCKAPENLLFWEEIELWNIRGDVELACTVDQADPDWKGNIGLITSLIPGVNIDIERTNAIAVGPPVMYKYVINELLAKGIQEKQIFVSFERHMKCGVGHCGHCQIGPIYCCKEGPVFQYSSIKNNIEAL